MTLLASTSAGRGKWLIRGGSVWQSKEAEVEKQNLLPCSCSLTASADQAPHGACSWTSYKYTDVKPPTRNLQFPHHSKATFPLLPNAKLIL